MKNILIFVLILVILGLAGFIFLKPQLIQNSPTPITNPTASTAPSTNSCTVSDLKANFETEGAAGSIYGTIKITNISDHACDVTLGNYVLANFTASNISTSYEETGAANENFSLIPNASVYSQVHFPNGPQCQSSINPQNVSFTYHTQNLDLDLGNATVVQACSNASENTQIDIWPVSKTPIS